MSEISCDLLLVPFSVMGARAVKEKPVPDVALAVVHDRQNDKVLLIRRGRAKHFSGWAFPGGKVESRKAGATIGESVVDAARRELMEETGLRISRVGREIFCRR